MRIVGGRELHLRSLQPLGMMIANSIFTGHYLTTKGQPASADRHMIDDLGFVVTRPDEATLPRDRDGKSLLGPAMRHMGAGTELPAKRLSCLA